MSVHYDCGRLARYQKDLDGVAKSYLKFSN
jgi:hypothetical protein